MPVCVFHLGSRSLMISCYILYIYKLLKANGFHWQLDKQLFNVGIITEASLEVVRHC